MVRREPSRADYLVDLCLKYFFRAVIVSLMLGLFVEALMKLNVSSTESLPFQHLWVLISDLLSNQEVEGEVQNFGGDLIRASIESFKVCVVAIALTLAIALPSGVVLGRLALMVPERRLIGRLFGGLGALFCLTIASMPGFLLAILFILYLVEYQAFPVFELIKEGAHGFEGKQAYLAAIWRLLLPATVVAIPASAWLTGELSRILRRTCAADFVQAAEDRALSGDRLYFSYVVKNSMRNIGGAIYRVFPFLLGSLILVEWLFHFQGIGLMIWSAAANKDFLKLFATGLASALMVMACGFLLELLFGLIDRKTRQQGGVSLMIGNGVARAVGNKQVHQKMLKRMKQAWALVLLFVCVLVVIYFLSDREAGQGYKFKAVSETLLWGLGLSLMAVMFSFFISACLAYLAGGHFYHWTSRIHASVITVPAMYWLLAGAAVFVTDAGLLFVIIFFIVGGLGVGSVSRWFLELESQDWSIAARTSGLTRLQIFITLYIPELLPRLLARILLLNAVLMVYLLALGLARAGNRKIDLDAWGGLIFDARQSMWENPEGLVCLSICVWITALFFALLAAWGDSESRDSLGPEPY